MGGDKDANAEAGRLWMRHAAPLRSVPGAYTLGIFRGEGIGPEVIDAALSVLRAVEQVREGPRFDVRFGGAIGHQSLQECGRALSPDGIRFCREIFAVHGAILAGAGGERFVYEARREFQLYCKFNPIVPSRVPLLAGRIREEHLQGVDILVIRENLGGVYQGTWSDHRNGTAERVAEHRFSYTESQVRLIAGVAAGIARGRRGDLTVVVKPNGVPAISQLWLDCTREAARDHSVTLREMEIDNAAFQLVQNPRRFDVVLTPNLFGDVLADLGGVLLGSRGLCFGGSVSREGAAVYQTNHGAAHELAGSDRANPIGQIQALAMLLRESFLMDREARLIETAIDDVLSEGLRTEEIAEPGCRVVGPREMADRIAFHVGRGAHGSR